jgi:hypothetical protein
MKASSCPSPPPTRRSSTSTSPAFLHSSMFPCTFQRTPHRVLPCPALISHFRLSPLSSYKTVAPRCAFVFLEHIVRIFVGRLACTRQQRVGYMPQHHNLLQISVLFLFFVAFSSPWPAAVTISHGVRRCHCHSGVHHAVACRYRSGRQQHRPLGYDAAHASHQRSC